MREKELIVYRDFGKEGKLLSEMAWIARHYLEKREKARGKLYACMSGLLELAGSHGFYGNIWHCYLSNLLVSHENSYSRSCEIRGAVEGTVNEAVLHDIAVFRELFTFDYAQAARALGVPEFSQVLSYQGNEQESRVYNARGGAFRSGVRGGDEGAADRILPGVRCGKIRAAQGLPHRT